MGIVQVHAKAWQIQADTEYEGNLILPGRPAVKFSIRFRKPLRSISQVQMVADQDLTSKQVRLTLIKPGYGEVYISPNTRHLVVGIVSDACLGAMTASLSTRTSLDDWGDESGPRSIIRKQSHHGESSWDLEVGRPEIQELLAKL